MDAVRVFNNELSSLYESKPPVSRAKMAQITKCAIKAIKFYKHVVQSVEKFIQKCKPEYKVPGLYVIDSIVRQSRHQFGPEKDVFSPRFTKNIVGTFTNLLKCPVEERSRVIRVLNLWQKNSVFTMEVIQPLLDLAADPDSTELVAAAQRSVDGVVSVTQKVPLPGTQPSSNGEDSNSNQIIQQTEMLSTITKLLQQAQEGTITNTAPESQLQQLQNLQQQLVMQTERISKPQQQATPPPPIDSNLLAQIQVLTSQLLNKTSGATTGTEEETSKPISVEPSFNKKLLEFDYGDSDEDDDREDHQQPPQQPLQQPSHQPLPQPPHQPQPHQPLPQPTHQPLQQPTLQLLPQPPQQPLLQPSHQPLPQPPHQPQPHQPLPQPTHQPLPQPTLQLLPQPPQQPLSQPPHQELQQQPNQQQLQQPHQQNHQQPNQQQLQQPQQQLQQQPHQQPNQQQLQQPQQQLQQQPHQQLLQQLHQHQLQQPQQAQQQLQPQQLLQQPPHQLLQQPPHQSLQQPPHQPLQQPPHQLLQQPPHQSLQQPPHQPLQQPPHQPLQQPPHQPLQQPPHQPPQQPPHQPLQQPPLQPLQQLQHQHQLQQPHQQQLQPQQQLHQQLQQQPHQQLLQQLHQQPHQQQLQQPHQQLQQPHQQLQHPHQQLQQPHQQLQQPHQQPYQPLQQQLQQPHQQLQQPHQQQLQQLQQPHQQLPQQPNQQQQLQQPHQQLQQNHQQPHQQRPPQGMPPVMPDQNLLQHIQQMSQQKEQLQSEIGSQDQLRRRLLEQQQQQFDREIEQESLMSHHPSQAFNQDQESRRPDDDQDNHESHNRTDNRRRRESSDRSRSPRRRSRRSRSRSRDRDRRRRSRSRERHRRSRSRERERREREKERERRKVGLPPIKENSISICSTTVWFGRLTKHTTEDELREHIEKYGTIRTINMIPPRGCAFVSVTKRKDAFKVLDRLKGIKINGNVIKVAWAPGIGVKESTFKDLWDVDQGVTYIPWEQLPKDVVPLLAGGMVDEESLPQRLKGMKTGEEEEAEPQQQQNPSNEGGVPQVDNVQPPQPPPQQPPQPLPMGMPGQLPNFPLPGQNPFTLMGPGGPLSLLSGPPPPIGIRPGMGPAIGLGGPNNLGGPNMMGNPNINPMAGFRGPQPNLPGMGPRHMNMGPQGPMMRGPGNYMGGPGGPNPSVDALSSPAGVNSPGPRGPFGQFPHMQSPGGMRPPFVNNGGNQAMMRENDMRAIAETMEWPPDDEVNAEDESDDDQPMDSDERMLPMNRQQHMPRPGMPNLQALANPFRFHRPMMPGQGPPNAMLGIPRAPSPNMGMPSLISLHMMPPPQQQPVLTVPVSSAPGFTLAPGGIRLPMPNVGLRQGLVPAATSPLLLPPSTGAPVAVSVNGSVVVTGPGLPATSVPISVAGAESPAASSEVPSPEEDNMVPRPSGPVPLMQIHGENRPPSAPVLGRGFAPMTIRPRAGPGLLGIRPGAHGGGGFNRFGGPRPLMGPAFGGVERPPFGNRFGAPLRPPVGFLDQDEREDRDERRPLPRIDVDDHPVVENVIDQSQPKDIDERRDRNEGKGRHQDIDMRQDIDERSKQGRASGRPSRWCSSGGSDESSKLTPAAGLNTEGKPTDNVSVDKITEISAVSTPSVVEGVPVTLAVQPAIGVPSDESQAPVMTKNDSATPISAEVAFVTKTNAGGGVVDGAGDAIQSTRSIDAGDKASS